MLFIDLPRNGGESVSEPRPTLSAQRVGQPQSFRAVQTPRSATTQGPSVSAVARSEASSGDCRNVDPEHSITPQQLEFLALYASGYSYEEIASAKFFSYHGVRKSLARAVERSGARNLTHLVAVLVEVGMLRRNSDGHYAPVQDLRVVGE